MTKKNDAFISESDTEDGAVGMGHNRLINSLLNTPFPLSKDYELREATNGNGFEIYLSDDKKSLNFVITNFLYGDWLITNNYELHSLCIAINENVV